MLPTRFTLVLLCLSVSTLLTACKKDDSGTASNATPGMGAPSKTGPATPHLTTPRPMRIAPLPAKADDLDRMRHQQRLLGQVWLSVRDVKDLKEQRGAILSGSVAGARLTLQSLKSALSLPPAKLKIFFEKNARIRMENKEVNVQIRLRRRVLRKLPGGKEALRELSREIQRRTKPIYQDLLQVTRDLMKRRKEIQAAQMRPAAMGM